MSKLDELKKIHEDWDRWSGSACIGDRNGDLIECLRKFGEVLNKPNALPVSSVEEDLKKALIELNETNPNFEMFWSDYSVKLLAERLSKTPSTPESNDSVVRAIEECDLFIDSIKAYSVLGDTTHLGVEYLTKIKSILQNGGNRDE